MLAGSYDLIIRRIFSIATELLGVAAIILPRTVREHFFSSRQRIVSFIFLMLFVNGAAKFFMSAMKAIIDLFDFTGYLSKFSFKIMNLLSFTNPYDRGYNDGYDDGRRNYDTKMNLLNTKTSIWLRLWKVLKYALVLLLLYSVIMTAKW